MGVMSADAVQGGMDTQESPPRQASIDPRASKLPVKAFDRSWVFGLLDDSGFSGLGAPCLVRD